MVRMLVCLNVCVCVCVCVRVYVSFGSVSRDNILRLKNTLITINYYYVISVNDVGVLWFGCTPSK